jgi:thiamine biosynthesis lipoprotein
MRVIVGAFFACLICCLPVRAEWFSDRQDKMGTRVEVQLWHDDPAQARRLIAMAMTEFDRIEAVMSTYRADSEISGLNAHAAERPMPASPELFGLLQRSIDVSKITDGAFDITFDSLGFLYDYRERLKPTEGQIRELLPKINYRHLILDPVGRTVKFSVPGTRINLGGIAKGYSVERVIGMLRAAGVTNALATAGGDTRLLGDRRGKPWIVGIRDPDDANGWVTRLALQDEAISTSGDYERFFIENGVRYHHILNPRTGRSPGGVRSVSIIGPDATMTDGLSKVFVLGPERAIAIIESVPGYDVIVIDNRHRVRMSKGLSGLARENGEMQSTK